MAADREGIRVDGISLGLFLLRVVIGVTVVLHGYNHIWGGGKIKGTAGWFGSLGMKPAIVHAWLASIVELAAGGLLIVGLLTPFAAAGVVGVMTVAFMINHRTNGFFIFRPGEGYEYVLNLAVAGLALSATGAGQWSIDHALGGKVLGIEMGGTPGFIIGMVGGVGGGLALLAACWRPEPKAAD